MAIRDVTIAGVRGISHAVSFDLRGQSLLLHGDNGTGKSSFERALRWALRGEDEPTSDAPFTTEESFRRHVRVGTEGTSVTVSFTDGSKITVRPGSFQATGNGEAIREACVAGQPFLRRSELLTVLGAKPSDRFAYFETFLGLQRVDQVIEEIAGRRSATHGRTTSLANRVNSALEPLRSLTPARLGPTETLADLVAASEAWAEEMSLSTASPGDRSQELRTRASSLASGDTSSFPYRLQKARATVEGARSSIDRLVATIPSLMERETELRSVQTESADVELLSLALEHFRHGESDTCPICKQAVSWREITGLLEARLTALEEYRNVRLELGNAIASLREASSELQSALREAADVTSRLGASAMYSFSVPPQVERVISSRSKALSSDTLQPAEMRAALVEISLACERAVADVYRLEALIPNTRDLPELQTAASFYERLGQVQPAAELLIAEHDALAKESESLSTIADALRRSRQDVAKETLTAIQDLVSEYYFAIHPSGTPDDATGSPSIDVQRHGRGTAFVRGQFGGVEIKDPTWVYSDGHLDTVGLCIFLALRRFRSKHLGDPKLMILDDVIISIDLGHSRRFLNLLRTAFGDHQVLILTHNGLFAHWCKTLLPGLTRLEIKGWSLDGGPRLGDYTSARERLERTIVDGTAKEIAVALMDLLDEWTTEARYEYQVAVPAKPGEQYTLTDIWEPLVARLRVIAKSMKSDLGGVIGLLDSLKDVPQVRNALAGHFNEFAQEFPRALVATIATNACKLIDALYCRECSGFVVPIGSRNAPSLMGCPGHHIQFLAKAAATTSP